MRKAIIALVGPSGCGKSTLLTELLRRFPSRLTVLKSLTTRPKRSSEDDLYYRFVTAAEFERMLAAGEIIQHVRYADHYYGNDRPHVEEILSSRYGINAMTEEGVLNFRRAGYHVAAIRILPVGAPGRDGEARKRDDEARASLSFTCEMEIENRFEPGGLDDAAESLASYIGGFLMAFDARANTAEND